MNEKSIQNALKSTCKNPFWQEYYQTAPSKNCKRYIELKFYYSECLGAVPDYEEFNKACILLENEFTKEDWLHLYKYCANNPKKVYYRNKLKECSEYN